MGTVYIVVAIREANPENSTRCFYGDAGWPNNCSYSCCTSEDHQVGKLNPRSFPVACPLPFVGLARKFPKLHFTIHLSKKHSAPGTRGGGQKVPSDFLTLWALFDSFSQQLLRSFIQHTCKVLGAKLLRG